MRFILFSIVVHCNRSLVAFEISVCLSVCLSIYLSLAYYVAPRAGTNCKRGCFRHTDLFPNSDCWFSLSVTLLSFLPARRSKRCPCYGFTITCLGGWVAGWVVSVTLQYCIKTAKPIWKLFRPSESTIILVSWDPCIDTQFHGEPLQWGVKYTGVGKISDFRSIFDGYRRLSRKRCEIGRWLRWNVNRKSWVPDWMV